MQEYNDNDEEIKSILRHYNVSYIISKEVISLISRCRNSKYKWLNINYITISSYILVTNYMTINDDYIKECCYMIDCDDKDFVYRNIYRYCLYILQCNNF